MKHSNLSALVLSGGQSRRADVDDKGLANLAGKPMIHYILTSLRQHLSDIAISTHQQHEGYSQFDCSQVNDHFDKHLGPLAGIHAGLLHCNHEQLFVLPCDSPFLNTALISSRLLQAKSTYRACIAVAHDGEHIQPTIAIIDRAMISSLSLFLNRGGRRLMSWFKEEHALEVGFSDHKDMFFNINTRGDIEQAEVYLNSQYK
ncbi:MAG: molybdenum cofactor guanylyltransferase MobA [Cycloclasticus sp.]|nr:molybdenum cofactor guanylyltransferase MobA [Cycloclasticus sp.]